MRDGNFVIVLPLSTSAEKKVLKGTRRWRNQLLSTASPVKVRRNRVWEWTCPSLGARAV